MRLTARWLWLLALVASLAVTPVRARAQTAPEAPPADDAPPGIHVADGFSIELVAGPPLVERPITAAFDDAGHLYVAESSGSNDPVEQQLAEKPHRIVRLTDIDGDGHYDERVVFADQMMFPEGTMFLDGSLYVSAPPSIWKLTDADGDGVAEQREEWFKGTLTGCANDLHGPYAGPDGWIYWCKGAFAEQVHQVHGREFRSRAAHIWRTRPDGSGLEPVMTGGMDNPVDVVFTPSGERIFSATFLEGDGRRDGLAHAIYGGVYGKNHGVLDGHPRTGELMPALLLMNSAAPSGLERYESNHFGDDYRDNLFVAEFNTRKVSRQTLTPTGSTFAAASSDFVWGDSVDFHPTDVLTDADGTLLVVDTGGWYKLCCPTSQLWKPDVLGGIYRVRRNDAQPVDDPRGLKIDWAKQTVRQLWDLLGDARPAVRQRAARSFASQCDSAGVANFLASRSEGEPLAGQVADGCDQLTADLARTWTLIQIELAAAQKLVRALLDHADPRIRQAALHGVSLHRDAAAAAQVFALLADADPAVRRTAAEASGRLGNPKAIPYLLRAAATADDRVLQHSIAYALLELGDAGATRAGLAGNQQPGTAAVALIALDQMPEGNLAADDVLIHLDAADPRLSAAANWVVTHHPEWGGQLAAWFQKRLASLPAETEEDGAPPPSPSARLVAMLAAFAGDAGIQTLIAATAQDMSASIAARIAALRAMELAPPVDAAAWPAALAAILSSDEHTLHTPALAAARRQVPRPHADSPLHVALTELFNNPGAALSERLAAAALVAPALPSLGEQQFTLLTGALNEDSPSIDRTAAADALAAAPLSAGQLVQLVAVIPAAGPLELNKLVGAFAKTNDAAIGRALLDALEDSPALSSLRLDLLRIALKEYDTTVTDRIAAIEALVNVDAAAQRARIEELLPAMASGDVRRGHAVFNSAKASCSACHRMGYGGGATGPELSKIGEIRTERDLLESILFPSLSFVRSYEPMLLVTSDGRAVSGVIRNETEHEYVVATGPNEEVRLPRDIVEEVQPNTISVMPAGLDKQLTVQELADLVAFLKNAK
ncbi:PVC-type heme-binding CxxCH protein [Lacipirellula sp.]|uniref:PVC-type heme-binding CxxCH protein n=1 Tax=Lacipirellula sp. TaxID=2691419 RepID=UPI003D127082